MWRSSTEKGAHYEEAACRYLEERGLTLLEKNFRTRCGEIDLVMRDRDTLVFIEVKFRASASHGGPLEAVTASKQRRIKRTALFYLSQAKVYYDAVRFDVLGMTKANRDLEFIWVKGAFE
ncbi:MAG: YraN family protein [Firmicutes bacterium]|nr:YraN family protein [Bacillota bacterium]